MTEYVQLSETRFKIPIRSFTAFKLSLDTAYNISETSKCILLGKIPDLWFEEETSGFVRAWIKLSRRMVRENLKFALGVVNNSVAEGDRYWALGRDRLFNSDAFDIICEGGDDQESEADEDEDEDDTESGTPGGGEGGRREPSRVQFATQDPDSQKAIENDIYDSLNPRQYTVDFYKKPKDYAADLEALHMLHYAPEVSSQDHIYDEESDLEDDENYDDFEDAHSKFMDEQMSMLEPNHVDYSYDPLSESEGTKDLEQGGTYSDEQKSDSGLADDMSRHLSSIELTPSDDNQPSKPQGILRSPATVTSVGSPIRFAPEAKRPSIRMSSRQKRRNRSMNLIHQVPVEDTDQGDALVTRVISKVEGKVVKRMMNLARRKKTRTKPRADKQKVIRAILQNYAEGEVIKHDKMLVHTRQVTSVKEPFHYTENTPYDTRVYERWKEFIVVLRKNLKSSTDLLLEFHDVSKYGHQYSTEDLRSPEIFFHLDRDDLRANFCSIVDKTISISVRNPKSEQKALFIYILQCHDQFTLYRWLFFLKEILSYKMNSSFQIKLPALGFSIDIKLPLSVLKSLYKSDIANHVEISKLATEDGHPGGYSVEYTGLVKFLKEALITKLEIFEGKFTNKKIIKHLAENSQLFWLCYRYYDRLEWATHNNHTLFLQNLLKSQDFLLELHLRQHSPRKTIDGYGKTLLEPTQIEGFLSRLTDIFGDERKLGRKFYKIQYFYTCDNILFYTKFYQGVPPSPNNRFIDAVNESGCGADQGLYEVANSIPEVYEHSPFPLNSDGYIEWLNEEQFSKKDHEAHMEQARKTRQIVKAEGMVDLGKIRSIRIIPTDEVPVTEKRLLSIFWYLKAFIDDDEITDSMFEIEMMHGGRLKLQAPSKHIRNEWVTRLRTLKTYWDSRKSDDLKLMMKVRQENKSKMKFTDYTDSNISSEAGNVELSNSVANLMIYNMDCVSITKCVLMCGYLYMKPKKHANFTQYYAVLCSGFLILFHVSRRSKVTGMVKDTACLEHYITVPLIHSYIYSGETSSLDLLSRQKEFDPKNPGHQALPRLYPDGWRSEEEETLRCFSLWVGKRRDLKYAERDEKSSKSKNPGFFEMYKKFGFTGKKMLFLARSRQERELWVTRIMTEIDRGTTSQGFS